MSLKKIIFPLVALALGPAQLPAQTFSALHTFSPTSWNGTTLPSGSQAYTNSDGASPQGGCVASGMALYGTASNGGSGGCGTVFKMNMDGSGFSTLHNFTGASTDGAFPMGCLVLSSNTLYGTTYNGGSNYSGTVFKVNTDGTGFSTLHDFTVTTRIVSTYLNSDGAYLTAGLALSGSTLYGTASRGGTNGCGTLFKLNTDGSGFSLLHTFGGTSDGNQAVAGLVLSEHTLYGTTEFGGTNGYGTVFKVNTDGSGFVTLHTFPFNPGLSSDGSQPRAGLVLSSNTLYGTTFGGGSMGEGTVFKLNTDGTGFVVLHSFPTGTNDGIYPAGDLTLLGNTLYGTTTDQTVFRISTDGSGFTTLYTFDGADPMAGILLVNGTLYGTTYGGGSAGNGTVYALSLLPPVPIPLNVQLANKALVLSWANSSFSLQTSPTLTGTYTNIAGAMSPYTNAFTGQQDFFRLRADWP